MPHDGAQRRDDLAATSESLIADADRIKEIERQKQDLELGDPRLDALSREAERLARQLEDKSQLERELSEVEPDGPPEPPIRSN